MVQNDRLDVEDSLGRRTNFSDDLVYVQMLMLLQILSATWFVILMSNRDESLSVVVLPCQPTPLKFSDVYVTWMSLQTLMYVQNSSLMLLGSLLSDQGEILAQYSWAQYKTFLLKRPSNPSRSSVPNSTVQNTTQNAMFQSADFGRSADFWAEL